MTKIDGKNINTTMWRTYQDIVQEGQGKVSANAVVQLTDEMDRENQAGCCGPGTEGTRSLANLYYVRADKFEPGAKRQVESALGYPHQDASGGSIVLTPSQPYVPNDGASSWDPGSGSVGGGDVVYNPPADDAPVWVDNPPPGYSAGYYAPDVCIGWGSSWHRHGHDHVSPPSLLPHPPYNDGENVMPPPANPGRRPDTPMPGSDRRNDSNHVVVPPHRDPPPSTPYIPMPMPGVVAPPSAPSRPPEPSRPSGGGRRSNDSGHVSVPSAPVSRPSAPPAARPPAAHPGGGRR